MELIIEEFDFGELIDFVMSSLSSIAEEKHIVLTKTVRETILLQADKIKIKQILYNLVSNAIKYTENGSIKVVADIRGNSLECSVSDTGCGIKPEDLPKIFEDRNSGV